MILSSWGCNVMGMCWDFLFVATNMMDFCEKIWETCPPRGAALIISGYINIVYRCL
jgi:hypothetical protein